jgi:DNA repair exonuclease SbcCD ATPase subunit
MSGFILTSIRIKGFRGFVKEEVVNTESPCLLLSGGNRTGKSSLLNAIEWCLFGKKVGEVAYGVRERKDWEVLNRKAADGYVELTFVSNNDRLVAFREIKKKGVVNFYFQRNGGTREQDEAKLHAFLGMTPADFVSLVHLHPETIRSFVIAERRYREDALNRLLGLSELENFITGVQKANTGEFLARLDSKFADLEVRLEERVNTRQRDLEQAMNTAKAEGVEDNLFNEAGASAICGDISERLTEFSSECNAPAPLLPDFVSLKGQQTFLAAGRSTLESLRIKHPSVQSQKQLISEHQSLGGLRDSYVEGATKLQDQEKELRKARAKETIEEDRKKALTRLKQQKDQLAQAERTAKILNEALEYFQKFDLKGKIKCPLCLTETTAEHVRKHAEEELAKPVLRDIQAKLTETQKLIEKLQEELERRSRLEQAVKKWQKKTQDNAIEIGKALGRILTAKDDPVAILNKRLQVIVQEQDRTKASIQEWYERLGTVNKSMGKLELILRVLNLKQQLDSLSRVSQTPAFANLLNARTAAEKFIADLDILSAALVEIVREERRTKLDGVKHEISQIFNNLTGRPDFANLELI